MAQAGQSEVNVDTRLPVESPDGSSAPANLLGLSPGAMQALVASLGEKPYRARQVLKWIHHHRCRDFDGMTDLSKGLRARLAGVAEIRPPSVISTQVAADGTIKWLLDAGAGNGVETVYIPEAARGTLCISSQVGCGLNCTFCATARQGFARNLTTAEIVGQVWLAAGLLAEQDAPLTNIVLMGMGEPLLNFEAVVDALEILQDDCGPGFARKRITLSTAGVVPKIRELRSRCPVSLAVSLHAPNDALRDQLVPINRTYPIAALLDACRDYVAGDKRQRITFEYVMLAGVNDTPELAGELVRLLRGVPAKVNLIPYNPVAGVTLERSPDAAIDRFRNILREGDLMTITRKTRGDDIDAACGQLAGQVQARGRTVRVSRGRVAADPAPI